MQGIPHAMERSPRPARRRLADDERARALERAELLARVLDSAFRLPGTQIRFGLDTIVGLIPAVGDTATALVGLYPVVEGARLGVRKRALGRMLANLGVDWLIGLVPVADLVLDTMYKAHLKNARLLAEELKRSAP